MAIYNSAASNSVGSPAVRSDPGNGGALNPSGGVYSFTTSGAETRTLADPAFVGAKIVLGFSVDGGNLALTVASGVNAAGDPLLTFDTIGDTSVLEAIDVGGSPRWIVVGGQGVTLSNP